MYKDSRGYVWIGTNNGLNKFNGTNFEVYGKDENNPESIGGTFIATLFEDSKGCIWVSSDNGILSSLRYPFQTGREFVNFDLSVHFQYVGGVGRRLHLFEDSATTLFAFSERGALFRLNASHNAFEPLIDKQGAEGSHLFLAMNKKLNEFYLLRKDSIFACTLKDLKRRHIVNTSLQSFFKNNSNTRKKIEHIGPQENRLWALAESGSLISFDAMTGRTSRVIKIPKPYRPDQTFIRSIGVNRESRICFGINNGGVLLYDTLRQKFELYTNPFELPRENRLAEVYHFLLDESGIFWIGTRSGIYLQSPAMNLFENYSVKQRNISYNYLINITGFHKHGSKLWIPTEDNTMLYDFESNTPREGVAASASAFFKDGSNRLYINTGGLQFF